jgi:hypothetical protein
MSNVRQHGNRRETHHQDVRPPNPPWSALEVKARNKAALSFYYSDRLSKTPIRDVSHKGDPKPDPNLETMTFGLFSRCDEAMRASIVDKGIETHFFCTGRRGKQGHLRVLTGYYRYGWYFKMRRRKRKSGKKARNRNDYALATKQIKFVDPGFPLADLREYLHGVKLERRFRTFKYVDEKTANRLLQLLNNTPDATEKYISEIKRVEQLVLEEGRRLYKNKMRGFSWDVAAEAMGLE